MDHSATIVQKEPKGKGQSLKGLNPLSFGPFCKAL